MKYSIILPVHNGGTHLKQCVESVLTQDLQDFDLLILENKSTDGTEEWLKSLNDSRIQIFPSSTALSIEENWARILDLKKNEFMTIIGHDDLLDRHYLSTIDALISMHPVASLYQTHFRYIDNKGIIIRKCKPMAAVQPASQVLHNFLANSVDIMGTGFMMRSRDYEYAAGIKPYANLLFADMELWVELSRNGYLAVAPEECFSYRSHQAATTANSTDQKILLAFDRFVHYLENLSIADPELASIIQKDGRHLLLQYCQGITHKVLRTPHNKRITPSVAQIIEQFREYGRRLKIENNFNPEEAKMIRIGKWIDENRVLHGLFLTFKKVYSRPVGS